MNRYLVSGKMDVYTGMGSLLASMIAGVACMGPMLAILLGVSGLGWLSSYSYMTTPASVISLILLVATIVAYRKRKICCINKRKHMKNRLLLFVVSFVVISVNVFEYIVLPNL